MAENTKIEWCDATFNPWTGCAKVSPGCDHCYAESWSKRAGEKVGKWGPGAPRVRTTPANWAKPFKWNEQPFFECPDCGARGDARTMGDEPKVCKHLNAKPARRRVFCASLADVFDNEVDPQWRRDLFQLIAGTPDLDYLLLTKRIGNAQRLMAEAIGPGWIPPNVWLGATIVNQEEADRDIPKLLATPARVRFLSMEPLLGPVTLDCIRLASDPGSLRYMDAIDRHDGARGVDWVIVGGESGHHARPMHPDWARSLRDQCAAAGVSMLFKQWGEFVHGDQAACGLNDCYETSSTGGWVAPDGSYSLGESSVPSFAGAAHVFKVGKKSAGRLLDGVEHNGFPEILEKRETSTQEQQ